MRAGIRFSFQSHGESIIEGEYKVMVTEFARPSAQIYHFPVSAEARRKARERRFDLRQPLAEASAAAVVDGSWYHEEAMREESGTKR